MTPAATFGPGIAMVTRTDIANGTPLNVGYVQEFSIDLSGNTKELYGQNQFPLVAARSTIKATGKFKNAVLSGLVLNAVFLGQSAVAGGFDWNLQEAHTVPAPSGPYTVSVTNAATFDQDLGVTYVTTGIPFVKVASSPAQGQYSVTAGVYTFNSADANAAVLINYTNTDTGSGAAKQSITVANKLIGTTPTFQLDYYTSLNQPTAEPFAIRLFACVATKMSIAFKLEDFGMPEFDFSFYANAAGNVFEAVFPQAA
jgi:hypothetical protein